MRLITPLLDMGDIKAQKTISSSSVDGLAEKIKEALIEDSNPHTVEIAYRVDNDVVHNIVVSVRDNEELNEQIRKYNDFGGGYASRVENTHPNSGGDSSTSFQFVPSPMSIVPDNSHGQYFGISRIKNRKESFRYGIIKTKEKAAKFHLSKRIKSMVPNRVKKFMANKVNKYAVMIDNIMNNCYHTTLTMYVPKK